MIVTFASGVESGDYHIPRPNSAVVFTVALGFAASFAFAILTLWVPEYWPVSLFEALIFALAAVVLVRSRNEWRPSGYPPYGFAFAVYWRILQCVLGKTAYLFATEKSLLRWTTFLAGYLIGTYIFQDTEMLRQFRAGDEPGNKY
ncbi:MAG: hypothetical protein ACYCOR_00135 [Acidobacteriaceae bacterium]